MSVRVRGPLGAMVLCASSEDPPPGRAIEAKTSWEARAILRGLDVGAASALRRLVAARVGTMAPDVEDEAIVARVAAWIASGTVRVTALSTPLLSSFGDEPEEPEAPRATVIEAPIDEEPEETEAPSFAMETDLAEIVATMIEAAKKGAPFCEECAKRKMLDRPWVAIRLVDDDGKPIPGARYRVELPDGSIREGALDRVGEAHVDGIDEGTCAITFPELDEREWRPA